MARRVAGRCQYVDLKGADMDLVTVAHRPAPEPHGLVGSDQVVGAVPGRKRAPAGHVVVVDVCLGNCADQHAGLLGGGLHPGDVARWVHHQGVLAVVSQVGPVAELGRLDGDDVHACS